MSSETKCRCGQTITSHYFACPHGIGLSKQLYHRSTKPPAPALPTSKQVTLTAKVYQRGDGKWDANVEVEGYYLPGPHQHQESKQALIQWVRDTYGIEPEVSDE